MRKAVCVFCSSSNAVDVEFSQAAADMGRLIGQEGHTLVYGGGAGGLMGTLARSVHEHGGRVIGIIPQFMVDRGVAYTQADELVITQDMRERKALMETRADAFVALPGGFGTLEELLEQMALRQLEQHTKPIVVVNTRGFYDHLVRFAEHICSEHFAKPGHMQLCHVASDAREALDYIDRYQPIAVQSKWA